jgi:hypothetical protein
MRKQIVILLIGLAVLINAQIAIPPSLGTGTESDPYQIATLENLYWIAADTLNFDKHYIQTADINAAETRNWFIGDHDDDPLTPEEPMGWKPIGNFSDSEFLGVFTGVYDGQGYTIDNLYINILPKTQNKALTGLFGWAQNAELKNINISNGNISNILIIGGLTAMCESSNIDNCTYSGIITGPEGGYHSGSYESGGLVGNCISSTIVNSSTNVGINGYLDYSGGLIGKCNSSLIKNCYSIGYVIRGYSGGLIGYSENDSIEQCYSSSDVTGSSAGGLVGFNNLSCISKSYSLGGIFSNYEGYSGGLTGKNTGIITNCFSSSGVTGMWSGGLVGKDDYNEGSIINSFSYGKVSGELPGGLISEGWDFGDSLAIVTNSFWDVETSEVDSSNGGIGLTTAQMKFLSTFTDAGWDFIGESANGTEDIWNMDGVTNNGYPFLAWMSTTGIEEDDVLQPVEFTLSQNYPNPFNPVTTIKFSIPSDQNVKLSVFNSNGQLVNELINKKLERGNHSVQFNAERLNSGIYFYRLESEKKSFVNKMLLIK